MTTSSTVVVPPIHLSSTYNFTGFNEPRAHDYSRRGNPTRDVVQRALAELEGGAGAVLTNTGMSAILLVTTVFLKPGDLLVAPHDCYGGSYRLFDSTAKRGCYRVQFVDQSDEQALRAALAENRSWCWWKAQVIHCCGWWILRKSVVWRVRPGQLAWWTTPS